MFNYERKNNQPVNPFDINGTDINISVASLYVSSSGNTATITGSGTGDRNATFYFGRAKPHRFFYDNITAASVITPVSVTAYCDLGLVECQNKGMAELATGLLADALSNEANWWFVQVHDASAGDGNVTLTVAASNGSVSPYDPSAITLTNGIDGSVSVTNGSSTLPNIVDVDLGTNTNTWLIYNRDADSIPSPFYRVRFIGSGTWSTTGNLPGVGNVVGDNVSKKRSNRVEW